ncbi:MAG: hypothetical protein HKN23_06175 [Verrucomicrobiales bacterium]|nr:hypothetical protein [Verrucomicrobiales bacterium]
MKNKLALALTATLTLSLIPAYAATRKSKSSDTSMSDKAAQTETAKIPGPSEASKKLVSGLTTTQKSKLLVLLNEGTAKDLVSIDGVAGVRAASIIESRPFDKVEQVSLVKGIGKVTFQKMIEHGKSLTARRSSSSSSKSKKS